MLGDAINIDESHCMQISNVDEILLILEDDLRDRFSFFEKNVGVEKVVLNLKNTITRHYFLTLFKRFQAKRYLLNEYHKIKPILSTKKRIFLSNAEGFIAKNIINLIKADFPGVQLVSLQHGIFVAHREVRWKSLLRILSNLAMKQVLGIYLWGDGFGEISTNKTVVYNEYYKNFLIKNGWNSSNVLVSSYYLKGFAYGEAGVVCENNTNGKCVALFLLQCLYDLGITSKACQDRLVSHVINKLSIEYDEVIIRQHPYGTVSIYNPPDNCIISNSNIEDQVLNADLVVSFFSTALLDFEFIDVPFVAIRSKMLKVDSRVYELFRYIYDFDEEINSFGFNYKQNAIRGDKQCFYEAGCSNYDELNEFLIER